MLIYYRLIIYFNYRTERALDKSGISVAPPKRTRGQQVVKSSGPSGPVRFSTRLRVKDDDKNDDENSENDESGDGSEESTEESGKEVESGEEVEKSGESDSERAEIEDESEDESEDKSEDKVEDESEDKVEDKVEDESEDKVEDKVEDESEDKAEDESEDENEDKVEDEDMIDAIGFVGPASPVLAGPVLAGPVLAGLVLAGPVLVGPAGSGPAGSGPAGPVGFAGPTIASPVSLAGPGPAVPAITVLPATPMKNKGKSQTTPDDNQEDAPALDPDSLVGDYKLKRGRERSGTGDARGIKTHRRSTSHSTAPTMPSTEDEVEVDPRGSSRTTGAYSRGRAMGNNYNWGDEDYNMDTADLNAPTYGKVLLFVDRETGGPPYMSFTTKVTPELPVVLKELSGRFSPIERRNSRIYVFEDEMWEVKGRFSQAVKDNAPLQWEIKDDGKLALYLLAVGVLFYILSTFIT